MKVLLILVDGMRPDALSGVKRAQDFIKNSTYTLNAKTVYPSDTLPCHTSLFHSVDPSVHNITTNSFKQGASPIKGLCETLSDSGKKCAFFYTWCELNYMAYPGSLLHSCYVNGDKVTFATANDKVTEFAIDYLAKNDVDFTFFYLGNTDAIGHGYGWMSNEYMKAVEDSWVNIEKLLSSLKDEYTVIITADHGGHDKGHGSLAPEDMTIPLMINGKQFAKGKVLDGATIKDIAPTVTDILGVPKNPDWQGKSLL